MTLNVVQTVTDRLGLTSPADRLAERVSDQVRDAIVARLLGELQDASGDALRHVGSDLMAQVVRGTLEMDAYQAAMAAAGGASRDTSTAIREYLEACREG